MSRREALAWAAGIFDGEGYIGSNERKVPSSAARRVPHLSMRVSQWHDAELVERFAATVGVGHVHKRWAHGRAWEWYWTAYGLENVQAAVAMLWPWLSGPKRRQAAYALESFHRRREFLGVRAQRHRRRPS